MHQKWQTSTIKIFTHKNYVRFVSASSCLWERSCLIVFVCVCVITYSDVQDFGISNVFTFWVPCCDVHIKTILSSSLPPVVSTRTHVLFTFIGVCLCIVVSNTYCVVFFVCLFLSTSCVLYTQCCQVLWIVHSWFPFRFSLMLLMRMAEALFSVAVQEQ